MSYCHFSYKDEFEKPRKEIEGAIYTHVSLLDIVAWVTPEPVSFAERMSGKKLTLKENEKWAQNEFECGWFNFKGKVPSECEDKHVVLLLDVNGEMCVFDTNGSPIRGLTNGSSTFEFTYGEPGKRVFQFTDHCKGGEIVDIWAEAGSNDLFGKLCGDSKVKDAKIAVCNDNMRCLYYDFEALLEILKVLPEKSARSHQIKTKLREVLLLLNEYTEQDAIKCIEVLKPLFNRNGSKSSLTISAIGHAHLDIAWLWPIRETVRKGARTFATALDMMDRYPEYVFGASQPQLYEWIKTAYPKLYDRIKGKVHEGRWEVQGGMWVEPDTNVPSGESLVRQILYGKRFYREEFGVDVKTVWLPDVFGYSGALPQIIRKSQCKYFMTQKLSWNSINKFPYHTFIWKGIDGSEVLVHMLPEETYNSSVKPTAVVATEENFKEKAVSDNCLMLFGIGNGGGGPGAEHLERIKRVNRFSELPEVKQEKSSDFFDRIAEDISCYKQWAGELYLECHRGTYTTQAHSKRYNRKLEFALRELEMLLTFIDIDSDVGYPKSDIEKIWKEVLLYQFHDILPGTSINRVYDESLARYEILMLNVEQLIEEAKKTMTEKCDSASLKEPGMVFNSLSWCRNEWVKAGQKWFSVKVPALGYSLLDMQESEECAEQLFADEARLENSLIRVIFDQNGTINSIYDKECEREIIPEGVSANVLRVYRDKGDAWDISVDYADKIIGTFKLSSSEAFIDGPCAILRNVYSFKDSNLTQDVVVTAGSKRIDFRTWVDWYQSDQMLRTSFPVDILATEATCDIQFGSIKRPTHKNTSWDWAKYEICAHKWVDISQRDYGVALLNDCKYGYKVFGNILDLNLLRSTNYPGTCIDRGYHDFTYSLLPHSGDHIVGGVIREGYNLNQPLSMLPVANNKSGDESGSSFVQIDEENIIVETIKQAEDSDGIIVRLYEAHGASVRAGLEFCHSYSLISEVDLMEENPKQLAVDNNSVVVEFKPYEIKTLLLSR